jgi:cleavage and polyadenylation specificity factor subunit 1
VFSYSLLQLLTELSDIRRRLIRRSTFHAGHFAIGMHLLPNTHSSRNPTDEDLSDSASQNGTDSDDSGDEMKNVASKAKGLQKIQQHVLVLNQTGTFALISPVDELLYLRLNALQTYLTGQLDHPCGLNPRGYRTAETSNDASGAASSGGGLGRSGGGGGGVGGGIKGVVDGTLLKRWNELPRQRQADGCTRVGVEEERLRADLEAVGGEGLGYL